MAKPPFGHESSAVELRWVLAGLAVLGVLIVFGVGALYFVMYHVEMPGHAQVVDAPDLIPPAPRLQAHPQRDIAADRAEEHAMLTGYAWQDTGRQFARIPIDRAMQMYLQKHRANQLPPAASAAEDER